VHGSGPNDRDETVGANKPFSAWHSGSRRAVSSCFVTTSERWFTEPGCLGGMLILHGERDYQVTAEEFARWKAALDSRPDVTFESYPAPNHLFIAGAGPSLPAEYQVPGHVAEEVIHDIATWVVASR
jgi:alpha-beta hydrolase superfamily lysophospholipase